MKIISWAFIALCLLFNTALADAGHDKASPLKKSQPQASATDAMAAIALFRKDPTAKDAQAALAVITNFAVKSKAVMVKITEQSVPWAVEGSTVPEEASILLTGAFLAGNIEAQLRSNIKGDSPYEGALLVLQVYKLLRSKNRMPAFEQLDQWQELETKGKLRAHMQGQ